MTLAQSEREALLRKDHFFVNEQVTQLIQAFQPKFEKVIRAHLFFHLIFHRYVFHPLCLSMFLD